MQLGGGIRDLDTIESYIDAGVTYVIIGTAAVKNPGFLPDACYAFPGHIIAGLDAKDGKVAAEGWSKMTGHDVIDLAKKFEEYGVEAIIYTDIGRDGMMSGVNIEATRQARAGDQDADDRLAAASTASRTWRRCAKLVSEGVIGAIAGRAHVRGQARPAERRRPPPTRRSSEARLICLLANGSFPASTSPPGGW